MLSWLWRKTLLLNGFKKSIIQKRIFFLIPVKEFYRV